MLLHTLRPQRIDVHGITLEYVETGHRDGTPVVFLHGLADSWSSFAETLEHLPSDIRAYSLTQRGHGDADKPRDGYSPEDMAKDVIGFLDRVGVPAAVLVGHSMGTAVAQHVALTAPKRVLGLVLVGALPPLAGHPAFADFDPFFVSLVDPVDRAVVHAFQADTVARPIEPSSLEAAVDESMKLPARVWQAAWRGLRETAHGSRLAQISAPTLLAWGDADAMVSRQMQESLLGGIPNSHLTVYPGVGHSVQWEMPARLALDIADFVSALPTTQPQRTSTCADPSTEGATA